MRKMNGKPAVYVRRPVFEWSKNLVYSVLVPRRIHVYCIGTPKTGTHSMAGLFEREYRAAHEPDKSIQMKALLETEGGLTPRDKDRLVKSRDIRRWLEVNSSALNYFFLDALLEQLKQVKFIVTIREPYAWLDSLTNHYLARGYSWVDSRFPIWVYQPEKYKHDPEAEAILVENDLFPLDCYLAVWARFYRDLLTKIPSDRLLVVRTHEISQSLPRVAEFLGIPPETLDASRSHLYKAAADFGILEKIDRGFLEERVAHHCGELMREHFPEIGGFDDALRLKRGGLDGDSRASAP